MGSIRNVVSHGGCSMNPLTVRIVRHYGTARIYPVCAASQEFAKIAGTKTLEPRIIEAIKRLGFTIQADSIDGIKVSGVQL